MPSRHDLILPDIVVRDELPCCYSALSRHSPGLNFERLSIYWYVNGPCAVALAGFGNTGEVR
jgi:hypothetical protein